MNMLPLLRLLLTLPLIFALPLFADTPEPVVQEFDAGLAFQYNKASDYYNKKDWDHSIREFKKLIRYYPDSEVATKAHYFLGTSYFEMGEYDFANAEFNLYLNSACRTEYFDKVLQYKFYMAEAFKTGHKRRFFQIRHCPKFATGHTLALNIYDEIIVAVPNHELAALSLYSKGCLQKNMGDYQESVDTFHTLIRRFPKNELAPQAYLKISEAYYQESLYEFQNPDVLALAEINARRYKQDFPRDEGVIAAEDYVRKIKELYAKSLCDLGRFYERIKKPQAAGIYYLSVIEEFPDTKMAEYCRDRLAFLGYQDSVESGVIIPVPPPSEEEETTLENQE